MTRERLLKKRYKRLVNKAKFTTKMKSVILSVYFLLTGKSKLKGFKKNLRNIKKPFYTFETLQGYDYKN